MPADGPAILKRYKTLVEARSNHATAWERMAPYIAPSRLGIITERSPGTAQTNNVYDSTMMMAAELLAMFIAGHAFNPAQQWFGLQLRDPIVRRSDAVMEWFEESRDRMLKQFSASLFYAEGPESIIDYAGFGTGFLRCEEAPQPFNRTIRGFRGFHFEAKKTGRFVIAEGPDGLVDTDMSEFELTAEVMVGRWGKENMPEKVNKSMEEGKPDQRYKIVHAILPRSKNEQNSSAKGMPWASVWIEKESKKVIHESGYRTFPDAIPRYHKTPGEVYGRGRGDLAFPDVWTLNTAKRMGLEDWALKIRPPQLVRSDSVFGTLRLTPGGATSLNTHGKAIQDTIMSYQTGSHPEVSQIKEEELRISIQNIFFVRQILQLLEVQKSEMTAFEFRKKIELVFRLLGPVYGRLEKEYLNRVIEVAFDVMMEAGAFSPPPPEVFQSDGEIDVVFKNPISKAQRTSETEAVAETIQDLAPFAEAGRPEVMDIFDMNEMPLGMADNNGVPAKWLLGREAIDALREQQARKAQQDEENQTMMGITEGIRNLAPMEKALASNPSSDRVSALA